MRRLSNLSTDNSHMASDRVNQLATNKV